MNAAVKVGLVGIGGYFAYKWYTGRQAAAPASSTALVPLVTQAPAPAAAPQMDSWYSQLKAAAAADSNFTGSGDSLSSSPDHWNVYLNSVTGYSADLDSLFGGIDKTTSIRATPAVTAAVFWAAVAPGLKSVKGLSGLGFYGGLGSLMASRGWN